MADNLQKAQRAVQAGAAKLANTAIRNRLREPMNPITQVLGQPADWWMSWNPFVPDWTAKSGYGLRILPNYFILLAKSQEALTECDHIVTEAMQQAMMEGAEYWLTQVINGLVGGDNA